MVTLLECLVALMTALIEDSPNIKAALEMYKNHDLVKEDEIPEILGRITGVTTIKEATEGCDFVIEAIAEDLEVKRKVWKEIEDYVWVQILFLLLVLQALALPKFKKFWYTLNVS